MKEFQSGRTGKSGLGFKMKAIGGKYGTQLAYRISHVEFWMLEGLPLLHIHKNEMKGCIPIFSEVVCCIVNKLSKRQFALFLLHTYPFEILVCLTFLGNGVSSLILLDIIREESPVQGEKRLAELGCYHSCNYSFHSCFSTMTIAIDQFLLK